LQKLKPLLPRLLVGALGGAIAGALYYQFIGCRSGQCGLTGTLTKSTLYFTVVGILMAFPSKKHS